MDIARADETNSFTKLRALRVPHKFLTHSCEQFVLGHKDYVTKVSRRQKAKMAPLSVAPDRARDPLQHYLTANSSIKREGCRSNKTATYSRIKLY